MLKYHADVDLRDFEGNTPLHYACWNGNLEICTALLNAGSLVDPQDQAGRTPLYYSVQHKHPDIVQFLLENHADPTVQTCTGVTPESLANQENIIAIVEIFQKFNKEQNTNDENNTDSNGNSDSSENLLGKDFTEEHNRMKVAIFKLSERRNKEADMLQKLQNSLDEHNAAMSIFQNNMKDTFNQLRTIEQSLKEVAYFLSSNPDLSSSSALDDYDSFFATSSQNMSQIPTSMNRPASTKYTGPSLAFTGLNSTSGSNIGFNSSTANGISPLLSSQNDTRRKNKDLSNVYNQPNQSMPSSQTTYCIICKTNPASVRCKNCRSPFCHKCCEKFKQTGKCPICNPNGTKADKS